MPEAFPTRLIEVEFTAGVWTDVTAYAQGHTFARGKQRELDQYQAGRLTLTLDNSDRRFDPEHATGPYSPNVKPMRRIRYRAIYNGVSYPRFQGFVTNWEQVSEGPNVGRCVVSAVDGFGILAAAELPPSVYAAEVDEDEPAVWWRLDESVGSTTVIDASGNERHGTTVDSPTFGATTLIVRDPGSAMSTPETITQTGVVGPKEAAITNLSGFAIECWVRINSVSGIGAIFGQGAGSSQSHVMEVNVGNGAITHKVFFNVGMADATVHSVRSSIALTEGEKYHIVAVRELAGMKIYIDGVDRTEANGGLPSLPTGTISAGFPRLAHSEITVGITPDFTFDEFAVYHSALSAARIVAHNAAGRTPWRGDSPGGRIGRLLDLAEWPQNDRLIRTGYSTLQSASLAQTALGAIQKTSESDLFGRLFVTADGKVRFDGRRDQLNQAERFVFTDQGEAADAGKWGGSFTKWGPHASDGTWGGAIGYMDLRPEFGDHLIRNRVTVSRAEGTAQTIVDAASAAFPPSGYGIHQFTADGLLHDSDTLSREAAEFLVNEYKEPKLRVSNLTLGPMLDPDSMFPAVLSLELGEEIELRRKPQKTGAVFTLDSVIEGITETVGPKSWRTSFNLSPALTGSFGAWGPSDVVSKWGVDAAKTRWGF